MDKVRTKPKKVCGFGINDADYFTSRRVNGKMIHCEIYKKWFGLINRSYGNFKSQGSHSTCYSGCTVSEEWRHFMDFKRWHEKNSIAGWSLDKDLLKPDNKEYGPEYCIFIPHKVNTLITVTLRTQWNTLPGISFAKNAKSKRFWVRSHSDVKATKNVTFDDEYEANLYYRQRKAQEIKDVIVWGAGYGEYINRGLSRHVNLLLNPPANSRYVRRRVLGKPIPTL